MVIILALIVLVTLSVIGLVFSDATYRYEIRFYYDPNGEEQKYGRDIWDQDKYSLDNWTSYPCKKVTRKFFDIDGTEREGLQWTSLISLIVLGLGLGGCLVAVIINRVPTAVQTQVVEYEMTIDKLKAREDTLMSLLEGQLQQYSEETYHLIIDKPADVADRIDAYNEDVLAFKKSIFNHKIYLDNKWTNWFTNPACTKLQEYNKYATSYRDVLGDTLKTFKVAE